MLEVLGAILLFFFLMALAMIWLGVRMARRMIRNLRPFAGGFTDHLPPSITSE